MVDYFIYLLTLSITPGPNTILSLQNASEKGLRKGIYLNYGMFTGIFVIMTVAYLFISLLNNILPYISIFLQISSIIYILYLSWKIYKKSSLPIGQNKGSFKEGFLLQMVNMKIMMLTVSAISIYIIPHGYSFFIGYLFSLMIPLICFITGLLWAVMGDILKSVYIEHRKCANIIFSLSLLVLDVKNIIILIKQFVK